MMNRAIREGILNTITLGDARELSKAIPDGSVDLIFTDPPYLEEYLPLYSWLSQEAKRVLKPDGFLLAYTGSLWKYQTMVGLGEHLSFFWDFIVLQQGNTLNVHRFVTAKYKSILCFINKATGQPRPRTVVEGLWQSSPKDKRFHKWGQRELPSFYYIDCFSAPGETVYDPFCGGGTTAYVCKVLGRNFISFDSDPEAVKTAYKRLETVQPFLFETQPEQIHLIES